MLHIYIYIYIYIYIERERERNSEKEWRWKEIETDNKNEEVEKIIYYRKLGYWLLCEWKIIKNDYTANKSMEILKQ